MALETNSVKGHVSGSFANMLFEWLQTRAPHLVDRMPFARPESGELSRVSVDEWASMLAWVEANVNEPNFPIYLAESVKPSNMGLLGYVAACSSNLGEAFARLQQFENLVYAINALTVEINRGEIVLRWGAENGRPGHLVDSVAVCVLLAFVRQLTGQEVRPYSVRFINSKPENCEAFENFFRSTVQWNARHTEVVFDAAVLGLPMRTPDANLRRILDEQAQRLLSEVRKESVEALPGIRKAIQQSVAAGIPTLQEAAKRMHMSTRTLQRKLQDRGEHFRDILQAVRMEMAENCLKNGELSLMDISALLGYNDQAAFTHAFKRAKGQTPASYRKNSRR